VSVFGRSVVQVKKNADKVCLQIYLHSDFTVCQQRRQEITLDEGSRPKPDTLVARYGGDSFYAHQYEELLHQMIFV